jgi:hypothetical protein
VLPDAELENPEFRSQNPEFSGIFFLKSGKNPERVLKVSFDRLKFIFLDQTIKNIILHLSKIYLNETIENIHQVFNYRW